MAAGRAAVELAPAGPPASGGGAADASAPGAALSVREVDLRTSIRPTVAEVDLGAVRRNAARLRETVGTGVALYGVVKADAYGHGAVRVGRVLAEVCDVLAVSLVEEGLELREAGLTCPILVLGGYYARHQSEVLEAGLTPVVYELGDLERFGRAPARRRPRGPGDPRTAVEAAAAVHLKVDTGMHRLGVSPVELPGALARLRALPRLRLEGLCTHLSSADVQDPETTAEQLRRFAAVLAEARAQGVSPGVVHAANSAAAVRFPEARFGAVRPGLALYGAMPSDVVARPDLEPALALRSKVMALHDVAVGDGVSYGGQWRATRPSRIATVPIGYADGYPRHVRGAHVLVGGRRAPVTGVVCMDMLMVDVTDLPPVALGDVVTLIGQDGDDRITLDDLAGWAGTINYEILCGLSKRVPRLYRDDDAPDGAGQGGDGRRP